jgi:predicted DNA repair protein MutK
MPRLLSGLTVVGTAAMLWVGGHILLVGTHDLGWHWLYDEVHHLEEAVGKGVAGWFANTAASGLLGLLVGALVVATVGRFLHKSEHH